MMINEYTITALAEKSATTVRNIRAYQEKGILPPAEKRGRVGIYNTEHVERLTAISQLLERGYSIANISELFNAHAQGKNIENLLGLHSAVTKVFTVDEEFFDSVESLISLFSTRPSAEDIQWAIRLQLVEILKDGRVRAPNPATVRIGIMLTHMGLRLEKILEVIELMQSGFSTVAQTIGEMFFALLEQQIDINQPNAAEQITTLVERFRPLIITGLENQMVTLVSNSLGNQMTYHMINHLLQQKQQNQHLN